MIALAHDIIVRPVVTEKSSRRMMEHNKYTFEVLPASEQDRDSQGGRRGVQSKRCLLFRLSRCAQNPREWGVF